MSPEAGWPWSVLGLTREADAKAVRHAYAAKLKGIDQSKDLEGFTALRQAYEVALHATSAREDELSPLSFVQPGPHSFASRPIREELGPDAELQKLLAQLATDNGSPSLGERIRVALHHQLAKSDETSAVVGRAIGRELVKAYRMADGVWPPSVTAQLLHELDAAYGWLSDYKACQSQFANQSDFVYEMSYRGYLPRPAQTAKVIVSEPKRGQEFRYKKPEPVAEKPFNDPVAGRWTLSGRLAAFKNGLLARLGVDRNINVAANTTGLRQKHLNSRADFMAIILPLPLTLVGGGSLFILLPIVDWFKDMGWVLGLPFIAVFFIVGTAFFFPLRAILRRHAEVFDGWLVSQRQRFRLNRVPPAVGVSIVVMVGLAVLLLIAFLSRNLDTPFVPFLSIIFILTGPTYLLCLLLGLDAASVRLRELRA